MADLSISQIIQESLLDENFLGNLYTPDRKPEGFKSKASHMLKSAKRAFDFGRSGGSMSGSNASRTEKAANATGRAVKEVSDNKGRYLAGAGLGTAAALGAAYGYNRHKQANSGIKGAIKKYGKTAAGVSLGAIGAGVGAKALLKYLRKKKKQG